MSNDIDDFIAKRLVEELRKPMGNGTVHWDSDVEGFPGWILQQIVHVVRKHGTYYSKQEESDACPACYYRFHEEEIEEAERTRRYLEWVEERYQARLRADQRASGQETDNI